MDKETIVGGLLHDVVEDTKYTTQDLTEMFSAEIATLVDGVTKLTQLNYDTDKVERQAENLRKMFLAMAKDIRVIIIKLADRLHNMRTMQYMKPEKQKEKSRETMDIYAPIADRLGISKVKVELDDLSLKYLEPEAYKELSEQFEAIKARKRDFVEEIMEEVNEKLIENGITATIDGRVKHLFSIYRKMVKQHKSFDQIYDLFAIRTSHCIQLSSDQTDSHLRSRSVPMRCTARLSMVLRLTGSTRSPGAVIQRTTRASRKRWRGCAAFWSGSMTWTITKTS